MKLIRAVFTAGILILSGCASHGYITNSGHYQMASRRYDEAADTFLKSAQKSRANELLFLMDASVALIASRRYDEAIEVLLRAEKMAEIKDYTSLSEEGASLVTSDNVKSYTGEDFEKVLINVYLALAFSAVGKLEDAQVEARKINNILHRMITEGKRNYQESPFARYLSGLIWEAAGEWNDAYVDYKYVQKLDPNFPGIGSDLSFVANRMGFHDDESRWRTQYSTAGMRPRRKDRAEIVVFFERGEGPIKIPRDGASSTLPRFTTRWSQESGAMASLDGDPVGQLQRVLDIESTSIQYLEDRMGKLVAKKMMGAAVKGAIAAGVGSSSDNGDLGLLIFQLLMAADQADLRCWRSLPADIQMIRIPVEAGTHRVGLQVLNNAGTVSREIDLGDVAVRTNQKVFLTAR
jgi:uncharacterized protein